MIRVAMMSDLHLECDPELACGHSRSSTGELRPYRRVCEHPEWVRAVRRIADLVLLAGDINRGTKGLRWAAEAFTGVPVIYVCGNQEFHGADLTHVERELRDLSKQTPNVWFLECDMTILELDAGNMPVRIVGGCLWTDYRLFGAANRELAMRYAGTELDDHRKILLDGGPFLPAHAALLHEKTRHFLECVLAEPFDGPTIVCTHHAPSRRSILPHHMGDKLNPSVASDLEDVIEEYRPDLWLHGHTHYAVDYCIGKTRVVSRPRGYPINRNGSEFTPFLIEL